MFLSLNKKIIYTTSIVLIIMSTIFIYCFYMVYLNNFLEQKDPNFTKESRYISTRYENLLLKNELINILSQNKDIKRSDVIKHLISKDENLEEKKEEISIEKKNTQELLKNYDEKYAALSEAIKVLTSSSILIIFSIFIMWMLLNQWVIKPIDKLSRFSKEVAKNKFSLRLEIPKEKIINDEFHHLYLTFNKMLDNIEDNINEIKSKEDFLQSLIDAIPDGIRVIDKDANIIVANKQYYKQTGTSKSPTIIKCYKSSQNLDGKCPKSMFTCPLDEILKNNLKNTKTIQHFNNNLENQLSINSAPLTINKKMKQEKFIVESIRDLSEDIRFSHQQKLSSVGFLATSVAHEMKNNLGSVRIITEEIINRLSNKKIDNKEIEKYLLMINQQVIDSINIPERLLKLAQLPKEKLETISCLENINDVVRLLDYKAKSSGISIKINEQEKNLKAKGTDSEFKIILINLIHNAFNAIKKNGEIVIDINKNSDKYIIIKITDSGHGIEKKNLKYIFDPFYSENLIPSEGTGLGLPIVKSIVKKFNGEIKAYSKKNVGTRFVIKLPSIKNSLQN